MEMFSDECVVVPVPVSDSRQNEAGFVNENTEVMDESYVEIEPEKYDFSIFLESDIFVDDVDFIKYREIMKQTSSPSFGHVVPEVAEEMEVEENMEQLVPTPPQEPERARAPRLKWTKELHASFVDATEQLGGAFAATPKMIWDLMKVESVSIFQVKSHLQKYRQRKNASQNWNAFLWRSFLFSQIFGGPSVESSQPSHNTDQRRHQAESNKYEKGSLYLKLEVQKHLQYLLEVQRVIVEIAVERTVSFAGKYSFTVNQNVGGFPLAADQNTGRTFFSDNNFMAPAATFNPYQLNLNNTYDSAPAINAGIREAHPQLLFEPSFCTVAASGSYVQGSNYASGESSGTKEMSDEDLIESFLMEYE